MRLGLITMAGIVGVMAAMPVANAQGIVRGAQEGAYQGNRAAGPVGGLVGGAVGAGVGGAVGGVKGVLGIPQRTGTHYKYRNRTVRQSDRVYTR